MSEKELVLQLLQAKYMKNHNIIDITKAFELSWITSKKTDLKIEVLIEALNNNIDVTNVDKYKEVRDGLNYI